VQSFLIPFAMALLMALTFNVIHYLDAL